MPLYSEWQQVLTRAENLSPARSAGDVIAYLRYLASQAHLQPIYFLWRPLLPDRDDDMVLELAIAAGCRYIITHNVKDFAGTDRFGICVTTPREFLSLLRVKP